MSHFAVSLPATIVHCKTSLLKLSFLIVYTQKKALVLGAHFNNPIFELGKVCPALAVQVALSSSQLLRNKLVQVISCLQP